MNKINKNKNRLIDIKNKLMIAREQRVRDG